MEGNCTVRPSHIDDAVWGSVSSMWALKEPRVKRGPFQLLGLYGG